MKFKKICKKLTKFRVADRHPLAPAPRSTFRFACGRNARARRERYACVPPGAWLRVCVLVQAWRVRARPQVQARAQAQAWPRASAGAAGVVRVACGCRHGPRRGRLDGSGPASADGSGRPWPRRSGAAERSSSRPTARRIGASFCRWIGAALHGEKIISKWLIEGKIHRKKI